MKILGHNTETALLSYKSGEASKLISGLFVMERDIKSRQKNSVPVET